MVFSKLKNLLGIESVKIDILLPENQTTTGVIIGKLVFNSMTHRQVESLSVKLVEHYSKGRRKSKEKQSFEMGKIVLQKKFDVPANQPIKVNFKLPYKLIQSEIDDLGSNNKILKGITQIAKMAGNIQSTYEIVAEAKVKGSVLHPFDKKIVSLPV